MYDRSAEIYDGESSENENGVAEPECFLSCEQDRLPLVDLGRGEN